MTPIRRTGSKTSVGEPLRYAHPFYTDVAPDARPADFSPHGQRMTTWIEQELGPIPPPRTSAAIELNESSATRVSARSRQ